jgi:hypothetical protein
MDNQTHNTQHVIRPLEKTKNQKPFFNFHQLTKTTRFLHISQFSRFSVFPLSTF